MQVPASAPVPRVVEPCQASCSAGRDDRQCRIWLNEARREIDRLRQGLDTPPAERCDAVHLSNQPPPAEQAGGDAPAADGFRRCPSRRLYAPPALGDVSAMTASLPPAPPPAPTPLASYLHVTNLGTLLDLLA